MMMATLARALERKRLWKGMEHDEAAAHSLSLDAEQILSLFNESSQQPLHPPILTCPSLACPNKKIPALSRNRGLAALWMFVRTTEHRFLIATSPATRCRSKNHQPFRQIASLEPASYPQLNLIRVYAFPVRTYLGMYIHTCLHQHAPSPRAPHPCHCACHLAQKNPHPSIPPRLTNKLASPISQPSSQHSISTGSDATNASW